MYEAGFLWALDVSCLLFPPSVHPDTLAGLLQHSRLPLGQLMFRLPLASCHSSSARPFVVTVLMDSARTPPTAYPYYWVGVTASHVPFAPQDTETLQLPPTRSTVPLVLPDSAAGAADRSS